LTEPEAKRRLDLTKVAIQEAPVKRSLVLLLLAAAIVGLGTSATAMSSSPPGATARCNDGTYSYAVHHQGACSHHGGVAAWLDRSSSSSRKSGTSGGTVDVGKTILLAKRTKTSGCKLSPNPDHRCSPGAYYSKLTKTVVCSSSFRTSSIRNVPQSEKYEVEEEYGMVRKLYGRTLEIDHIVSLELGGSNDIANLFPENAIPAPGYRVKDKLENKLHSLVCSGSMNLRSAQRGIATNWQKLYKSVYGVAPVG
jgi:hypothetical protein